MTGGGLPRNHNPLLLSGPGSGKTIFSLQFLVLVHGAVMEMQTLELGAILT